MPELHHLPPIVLDDRLDLAVIGQELPPDFKMREPALKYRIGRSQDLRLGVFVYLFGFQIPRKMVTT